MVFERTKVILGLLAFAIIVILLWSGITRINDYSEYHHSLGQNSVSNVSESISNFILERKRLIQVFSNKHVKLIKASALAPDNNELKAKLESEVKKYFPGYFAYTITNKSGIPYYIDFDGYIGDLCLLDINNFANKSISKPRVHPHHKAYHYDLLSEVIIDNNKFIFFISFPADEISNYLKSAQAIGHETILISKEFENIIEITAAGARDKKFREDYHLTAQELSFKLADKYVPGTSWTVFDSHQPALFSDFAKNILYESVFIALIFFLVAFVLYSVLKKEEQRRKKAEAIKSEFVAVISHELRTPLTSINGAIKLIENEALGPINDNIKKYLNMASSNIDRLTNIVNDILDVKKMESGEFVFVKDNISLVDVVKQAVKENLEYARNFNATFEFTTPEKDYTVYADRDSIMQVMANLLSNAVKYGAKEDNIKIYFTELSKSIRLNIEDHGEGLEEENKELLFEKFTQAHSREKEVVKGTGLGLNIIKNIVEKHDGFVSYDSTIGQGTVFYILLPLVK